MLQAINDVCIIKAGRVFQKLKFRTTSENILEKENPEILEEAELLTSFRIRS